MIRFEFLLTPLAFPQYVRPGRVSREVLVFGIRIFYWTVGSH